MSAGNTNRPPIGWLLAGALEPRVASLRIVGPTTGARARGSRSPARQPDTELRVEYIYLPPIWLTGNVPPKLPAVMMIARRIQQPYQLDSHRQRDCRDRQVCQ